MNCCDCKNYEMRRVTLGCGVNETYAYLPDKCKNHEPKDQPKHYDGERFWGDVFSGDVEEAKDIDHFEYTGEAHHVNEKTWCVNKRTGNAILLPVNYDNAWILRPVMKPTFKAGDWVIKAGLVGCSDNFPFQLTEKHIETLYYREDGQYSVTLIDGSTAVTWVIAHATEDDWRFERHGVRVMAKQLDGRNKGKIELHADAECTMYDEYNRNLAQALDIPIQPADWEEKK